MGGAHQHTTQQEPLEPTRYVQILRTTYTSRLQTAPPILILPIHSRFAVYFARELAGVRASLGYLNFVEVRVDFEVLTASYKQVPYYFNICSEWITVCQVNI